MPMSLQTAEALVNDACGNALPEAWPAYAIVSLAYQSFLDFRDWRWAAGSRASIALVASQARYPLPEDFGQIVSISGPSQWTQPVTLVTWPQLELFRAAGYAATIERPPFVGAIRWTEQAGGEFLPELELYPVPTTANDGPLEVSYLPGAPAPTENTDTVHLAYPPHIGPVWTQWLRAYALGLVEPDVASVDARLAEVAQGVTMRSAVTRDAGASRIKTPRGGAATETRYHGPTMRRFER